MTFLSHCLFLFIYLLAPTKNGSPQIALKNLMGQASSLDGKFPSELLLQSGVNSALSGWEPSPQATTWWALEGWFSFGGSVFCLCLVHVREERGMQGCVCLPDTFHSGGWFLQLSTHLSVRAGADSRFSTGFATGLTQSLAISVLRISAGTSQCVYVLACVSVC